MHLKGEIGDYYSQNNGQKAQFLAGTIYPIRHRSPKSTFATWGLLMLRAFWHSALVVFYYQVSPIIPTYALQQ